MSTGPSSRPEKKGSQCPVSRLTRRERFLRGQSGQSQHLAEHCTGSLSQLVWDAVGMSSCLSRPTFWKGGVSDVQAQDSPGFPSQGPSRKRSLKTPGLERTRSWPPDGLFQARSVNWGHWPGDQALRFSCPASSRASQVAP